MEDYRIRQLADWIQQANHITVLTGAGISTESGIPDFQSTDQQWTYPISRERAISKSYFETKPKQFWEIYKEVFQTKLAGNYEPSAGHLFLAELEKRGKQVTVVTQNVDGLHQKAGSTHVLEVHGQIGKARCPKHSDLELTLEDINREPVPRCLKEGCHFIAKPSVVLFGERIRGFEEAYDAVMACDLFLVIGTSLEVGPINQLPSFISSYGGGSRKKVLLNQTRTRQDRDFHLVIHQGIGETVNALRTLLDSST